MTSLSPSEELRSAAEKLRARAKKATPGPWRPGFEGAVWRSVDALLCESFDENDAQWIAMMSPLLAEPLAGMFGEYAARYDLHVSAILCHYDHGDDCKGHPRPACGNCASWVNAQENRCTCWDEALSAARVINGGGA